MGGKGTGEGWRGGRRGREGREGGRGALQMTRQVVKKFLDFTFRRKKREE